MSARSATYLIRFNDRLGLYQSIVRAWPEALRVRMLVAKELSDRGDFRAARRELETVRDLDPTYENNYLLMAHVAIEARDFDEAVRMLDRVDQIQPGITAGLRNRLEAARRAATTNATTHEST
jgi:thioredoxin-like negative regulator of GroEL